MVRLTTGGVLRSYRNNLMNSFITDNKARETVLTQRVFNSYAEDPAAASKTFRLRKSRMMTSSQLKICDDTYHKYQGAFASLQTVSELIDTQNKSSDLSSLKNTTLRMLNDPTGDARVQLNKVLDNLSDTIIQNMNQTYGDEFIFAGADGYNVPFTVEEKDGKKQLLYRGVPVDAAEPKLLKDKDGKEVKLPDPDGRYVLASAEKMPAENLPPLQMTGTEADTVISESGEVFYVKAGADTPLDKEAYEKEPFPDQYTMIPETGTFPEDPDPANAQYYKTSDLISKGTYDMTRESLIKDDNGDPIKITVDDKDYYVVEGKKDAFISEADYKKACDDAKKLEFLAGEKRFVDIGLGFQEDENGKLIESSAFNECLSGLTFLGYGEDEDGDPKNIYSIVQRLKDIAASVPEEGLWDEDTYNEFFDLVGKLEDGASEFKTQFTNQSAGTEKLKNNYDLLEDNVYNLKEQYSNLEDVNMADAITSFIWAEYCYNAALKVGNSVLSQSLMDYLQ